MIDASRVTVKSQIRNPRWESLAEEAPSWAIKSLGRVTSGIFAPLSTPNVKPGVN